MAKEGNTFDPTQRDEDGNATAAKKGESVLAHSDLVRDKVEETEQVQPLSDRERAELEAYPMATGFEFRGQHEEWEGSTFGSAASDRSKVGRVVVVSRDCEVNGKVYKAGAQDINRDDADALIARGDAMEPAGKKRGR